MAHVLRSHLRIQTTYVLLAGIWSGPVKPDMNVLLHPILTSIKVLNSQGIAVKTPVGTRTNNLKTKLVMAVFVISRPKQFQQISCSLIDREHRQATTAMLSQWHIIW